MLGHKYENELSRDCRFKSNQKNNGQVSSILTAVLIYACSEHHNAHMGDAKFHVLILTTHKTPNQTVTSKVGMKTRPGCILDRV